MRSGAVDIIVVDSVAALTPQAEIEGDMGDSHMGLQARLMSQALRKLTSTIGKSKTILVFINQIRMKIGVMFGNPETTTGGNALKFYASVRLEVRRIETIEKGDEEAIGNKVRVKVVKNKVAPPFRRVEMEIMFGKGISASGGLVDAAVKCGIIDKKGAWYAYGEEKLGQGRDNVKLNLEQNPELYAELDAKVRAIFFPGKDKNNNNIIAPDQPAAAPSSKAEAPAKGVKAPAGLSSASALSPGSAAPAAAGRQPAAKLADDEDGGLF